MARKLNFKSGNIQVNMSNDVMDGFENLVNELLPDTRRILDEQLDKLENDARKRWLVRKEDSQDSRSKIYSEVYVSPNMELYGVLGNTAPYAWAIKVGEDPQGSKLRMDRRLADGLLFGPMKRASNKIVKVFADEIEKKMK
jgi:hypothetical protein